MTAQPRTIPSAAVIGGGPAGLMAADLLSAAGLAITVYDRMPSLGRKLLMAGRGGLNLTHSQPLPDFLTSYTGARPFLAPLIEAFPPPALIAWCQALGQPTFVGSSGRVFPTAMKASPLLRTWLQRLDRQGVAVRLRHTWSGWCEGDAPGNAPANAPGDAPGDALGDVLGDDDRNAHTNTKGALRFETPDGPLRVRPDVTILALGGASWPRLGADAAWTAWLAEDVSPFRPANCGFTVAWSPLFQARFAGRPLKRLALRFGDRTVRGEAMLTGQGIEGGAIYALSAPLRDAIEQTGSATVLVDLRPDVDLRTLSARLGGPRRGQSLATLLRKKAGLSPEAIGLVQEAIHGGAPTADLASLIKAVPLPLIGPMPMARAISTAGGLRWAALTPDLMLRARPGVFAAGEMLDWEAPTGGYLLQACFATGVAAARGALAFLGIQT